jgi:DUF1680 family protein
VADDALAVHLYGDSTARFDISGTAVSLAQASRYPWDGAVAITLEPEMPVEFTLHLRIPAWSGSAALKVNGEAVKLADVTSDGYAAIRRTWKKGDRVQLDLEMPIERLYANPRVRQDAGRVALSRGPLIYCVEATDNDSQLHRLTLPRAASVEAQQRPDLLGGVVTLSATAQADAGDRWQGGLYRSEPPATTETRLTAIPYFAWDNREPGEMLVWLRDG